MPRICRTCEAAVEVLTCVHEWSCDEDCVGCEDYKQCETPLLVDVLAEILRRLHRSVNFSESYTAPSYVYPDAEERIEAALTRYQKEIVDA